MSRCVYCQLIILFMLKELISSSMNTGFLRSSQYIESFKSDIEYEDKTKWYALIDFSKTQRCIYNNINYDIKLKSVL